MPAPAVYIVVAVVGAVATGYVFKEFVYDPHIAPAFRDWRERRNARRTSRQRFHSPVPATPEYRPPHRSPTPSRGSPPIELNTVVTSEVDEWRTPANMRRRQTNNVLDERIPNDVEYPLLSPSTPLARSPPHVLRPHPNETTPIPLSPPVFSPAALPLASFAIDVDYTESSVDGTPPAQIGMLQSEFTSPQLTVASPFSDDFELARSQISEVEISRPGPGSDDEVFSAPSSMSSATATDDDDDDSLGSEESWHDIRNELSRF